MGTYGGNYRNGKRGVTSSGNRLRVVNGSKGSTGGRKKGGLAALEPRPKQGKLFVLFIALVLLFLAAGACLYIQKHYHVENIRVEGSVHYSDEEIIGMVTGQRFGDNSLFLSLKYKNRGIEGIPFVERLDVKVLSPDTIRISVYEKAVVGYVEYLDRYMYFDKDGIIVESSLSRTVGIPEITGITFSRMVMYEVLPVENQDVFRDILSVTRILSKYNLNADRIMFDDSYEMTLYFGDTRARLGNDDNLEEKVARLSQILPAAEGKKGVFRLENYTGSGSNVSFEQDK